MNDELDIYLLKAEYYLPDFLKDSPIIQSVLECLDALISKKQLEFEKIQTAYFDGLYKTRNYYKLSYDSKIEIVKELGFDYILDILTLNDEQLSSLLIFFNLIYILKGKKEGLLLCLNTLNINVKNYLEWDELTEEYPYPRQEFTAILEIVGNSYANTEVFRKLKNFVRSYMLPWIEITIILTIEGPTFYVYPSGGVLTWIKHKRQNATPITLEPVAVYDDEPAYDLMNYGANIYTKPNEDIGVEKKKCELTISTIPKNANVTINNVNTSIYEDEIGTLLSYEVSSEGYKPYKNHIVINANKTIKVELEKL